MYSSSLYSDVRISSVYSKKKKEISVLENAYSSSLEAWNGQTNLATNDTTPYLLQYVCCFVDLCHMLAKMKRRKKLLYKPVMSWAGVCYDGFFFLLFMDHLLLLDLSFNRFLPFELCESETVLSELLVIGKVWFLFWEDEARWYFLLSKKIFVNLGLLVGRKVLFIFPISKENG